MKNFSNYTNQFFDPRVAYKFNLDEARYASYDGARRRFVVGERERERGEKDR